MKLTELAAVSVAIALAVIWFDRKLPKFGSVVLGSGLELIYFTALADYAVPAVKVTDSIAVSWRGVISGQTAITSGGVLSLTPIVLLMVLYHHIQYESTDILLDFAIRDKIGGAS